MNSQKYWEQRKAREMYEYMEQAEHTAEEIESAYRKASIYIQQEAKKTFGKFQNEYGLTRQEAELLLKKVRSPEDIKRLKQLLRSEPDNESYKKLLDSQAYKARIDNMANLFGQLDSIILPMIAVQQKKQALLYEKLAEEAYYKSIFDIQQYTGYGFNFKALDKKNIEKVLSTNWSGKSFSQRIWNNTNDLAKAVKEEILLNLLTGRPLKKAQDSINNRFQTGASNARRLVRTESCYVCNQLHLKGYEACGIEKYIYLAILDLKTSQVCRSLDKKRFPVSEAQAGKNLPPMHPYCRATTIADMPDELLNKLKQSAVDPATGERITVPGDMTYKEWYEKYVEGKEDTIAKQRITKNKSYDKDQYERYRKVLRDYVPETFEKFSEIKYNNKQEYGKLKHAYRIANQYENNSGNMDPMDIVRMHDNAVECKAKFTNKARKYANMGVMELDGEIYIANSNVNQISDATYKNYKGDKSRIVLKTENPAFHPFEVGSHKRDMDSECKMFEYVSSMIKDNKVHNLKMLSEKNMCASCESVMKEFCEKHPNVKVEVVSHKKEKAVKNKNRNPIFEKDVERRYEREKNG